MALRLSVHSACVSILRCHVTAITDMFIYLHGFNSSGASAKGKYFRQTLAPIIVETPSYSPSPHMAIRELQRLIDKCLSRLGVDETLTLIGSSLGGFYAQYLSQQYKLPLVMINPALQPAITLAPFAGWQSNYYTSERYYFGENELAQLDNYDIDMPCQNKFPRLLLLDSGDELIDYRVAQQRYFDCAEIIVFPNGAHEFRHLAEAGVAILQFYEQLDAKSLNFT